ncbi:MAG: FHA domain-containing protein [Planctomycetota bacterium]
MKLRRRETGEEVGLHPDMVIGRSREADYRIEEESVSRRHARVEEREGRLWLLDLQSSNGIRRNGRLGPAFPLKAGDLITLGGVAFEVVGGEEAGAAGALRPGGPAPSPAAAARARTRLLPSRRSRGLGDLSQQPLRVQILILLGALLFLAGVFLVVRWLGERIAPR